MGTLYDLSQLEEMSGGDKSFVESLIGVFLKEMPKDLEEMKTSFQGEDYKNVGRIAHKMKSSLGMMGVNTLLDSVKTLQQLGEKESYTRDDKEAMKSLGEQIQSVIEDVLKEMAK